MIYALLLCGPKRWRRWPPGPPFSQALLLGVVYVAVAVWGFAIGSGESILSIVPINTEDSVLHLVIGVAGLAAAATSSASASAREGRTA